MRGNNHNDLNQYNKDIADALKLENSIQFQRIIESLPVSLYIINPEGVVLYANSKFLDLYEADEEHIGRKVISDYWVDAEKMDNWIKLINQCGAVNDVEMHLKTSTGKEFWAIGNGIKIQYLNETCILSAQIDISERKSIESALKISEEKYRLLTEFTSDVIWVYNWNLDKYTYVSPSIYYLTGFTSEEVLVLKPSEQMTEASLLLVRELIERNLQEFLLDTDSQKSYIIEMRQKCKDGEVIWVEASTKYRYNSDGEIEVVGASRNIEERKRVEREVLYLSYHDQLTGIYNRRFYEEELRRMNFQRNLPLTLVLADINGLKLTNDAFGHIAGDELLKRFTDILEQGLRSEDIAARIGGDEFVLLLPKTNEAGAETIITRIKTAIRAQNTGHSLLSVSFGWAVKQELSDHIDALFMQAEDRMYHQKLFESALMKNETIQLAKNKLYGSNAHELRHSENVGKWCEDIGKAMGLNQDILEDLRLLGRMHDIGKIGIQTEILNKTERLDYSDWLEIKRHPEIGYQILRSADEYVHVAEAVLSHHEWFDGTGYPRNLKGDEIPITARITAVVEAYETMVNGSIFRKPMTRQQAKEELVRNSGVQFDHQIVDVFITKVLEA